jgi:hypothetical protein
MPYERYGVTLLPAYNGVTAVSFHAGAYRASASGTMWAEENPAPVSGASIAPARGAAMAPTSSLRVSPTR